MPDAFDIFLSHNSGDRAQVEEIGRQLQARGLRVWLDKKDLRPGFPWQEGLEEAIRISRACAVFVGAAGLGAWQEPEMRAFIARSRREKIPVIPVLLPGCPDFPRPSLFLEAFTAVDLRGGLTEEGVTQLVWGITGARPESPGTPAFPKSKWGQSSGVALLSLILAIAAGLWSGLNPRQREEQSPQAEIHLKQTETRIRGQVVDGRNRALSGVRISRQGGMPGTALTDEDGRFELQLAEPSDTRIGLRIERGDSPPEDAFCYAGTSDCSITLEE